MAKQVNLLIKILIFSVPFCTQASQPLIIDNDQWTLLEKNNGNISYSLNCPIKKKDLCPQLKINASEATDKYNRSYLDYVIASHVEKLQQALHKDVVISIVKLDEVDVIRISSQKQQQAHEMIIIADDRQIHFLEFSALLGIHTRFSTAFQNTWQSYAAQLEKSDRSS